MSKEKQIIGIKECIDAVYGADCAYYDVDGFAIANEIYNEGYRKQEWISVEERLPEKSGYYLICQKSPFWCEEIIQTARWHISSQRFRGAQAGCFMDDVTHWMPLPEPPKMKGGAE